MYVADRLVMPTLSPEQIAMIGSGATKFDLLIRDFIRSELSYRFAVTDEKA